MRTACNPIRGTIWLPADVADLNQIDWAPPPEPFYKPPQAPAGAPEMAEVAA
jgi:hypothetical protein